MLHGNIHRHLLILSLANWAVAIVCWAISAYLGIAAPDQHHRLHRALRRSACSPWSSPSARYVLADFGTEPAPRPRAEPARDRGAGRRAIRAGRLTRERRGRVPGRRRRLQARALRAARQDRAQRLRAARSPTRAPFSPPTACPRWPQLLWITVAMVGARSAAMALNRLIDAEVDARNPRTAARELPGRPPRAPRGLALHARLRRPAGRWPPSSSPRRAATCGPSRSRPSCSIPTPSASRGSATTRSASRWASRRPPPGSP